MPNKNIITSQHVSAKLFERSRELRRGMTPTEALLWQRLRAGRLEGYHFRRQQVIDRFIVDFYCHRADLVVEVDGGVHLDQAEYDREREQYLCGRGLKVLRFTNTEVNNNLQAVMAIILDACQQSSEEGLDGASR